LRTKTVYNIGPERDTGSAEKSGHSKTGNDQNTKKWVKTLTSSLYAGIVIRWWLVSGETVVLFTKIRLGWEPVYLSNKMRENN
jgi:hypothetical protein